MKKASALIYPISMGILVVMILLSTVLPFRTGAYSKLGFPDYLMYLLPIMKVSGLAVLLFGKSKVLKEWAYAGFVFLLILATFAHLMIGDNRWPAPAITLLALAVSYRYSKK